MPSARSGSAIVARIRMRGSSDAIGSWKTTWTERRRAVICRSGRPLTVSPRKRTSPLVGASSASSIRTSVDLPDPDSPMMPRLSPAATARSISDSACTPSAPAWPRWRLS